MLVNKNGISKRYLALVHGKWPAAIKEVKAPLHKFERQSGERMVMVDEDGKASHTRTELLSAGSALLFNRSRAHYRAYASNSGALPISGF